MSVTNQNLTTVSASDRAYDVRKPDESHRYPVTTPINVLKAAQISNREDLTVRFTLDEEGRLSLQYSSATDTDVLTISATRHHNTGSVRIPSAAGAVLDLGDATVSWEAVESTDGRRLRGETNVKLPELDTSSATPIDFDGLDHITQDIDEEYGSWSQEKFRLYLNSEKLARLGWASNEDVRVSIAHQGGTPALVFEPTDETTQYAVRTASETGASQVDATLTVPNAVVRGFGFTETKFTWATLDEGTFIALPRNGNRDV